MIGRFATVDGAIAIQIAVVVIVVAAAAVEVHLFFKRHMNSFCLSLICCLTKNFC